MRYTQGPSRNSLTPQIYRLAETLGRQGALNQAIAEADPLGADEAFLRLPGLNEHKDTEGIREALQQVVTRAQSLPELNFIHCSSAIRDISMLGGSLVRFAIEPADSVPDFSEALKVLSAYVAAQIPRDSFIDYTSRNPVDSRERTFTSLPQEKIFIDGLRRGMAALDSCLENVMIACAYPFSSKEFAANFRSATDSFQIMIDSIVRVKRGITPEVFTHQIRPFFEPFRVGDRAYSAPSGAEMPILNIDQIIWGADCEDELYATYFRANMIRLPAIYQEISQTFTGQKSLITLLKDHLASGMPFSYEEHMSIQMLHHLLTRMYSFRMPHYRVAEDNVKLRQQEYGEDQEVKGSSGFGLVETKYVLDQTIKCRQITSQALSFYK
jgi:monodechloroaminopyrrolnitrin synthase